MLGGLDQLHGEHELVDEDLVAEFQVERARRVVDKGRLDEWKPDVGVFNVALAVLVEVELICVVGPSDLRALDARS